MLTLVLWFQGYRWKWSDQHSIFYTNWASGEPSESMKCAKLSRSRDGYWTVEDCDAQNAAVCKVTLGEYM